MLRPRVISAQTKPSSNIGQPVAMKRLLSHAGGMRQQPGSGKPPAHQSYSNADMRRTLSQRGSMTTSNVGNVQIITAGPGFPKGSPRSSQEQDSAPSTIKHQQQQQQLTQMQQYNRMQQAKLLGRHSDKFSSQMPSIVKAKPTLANLLSYQSPRQPKIQDQSPSLNHQLSQQLSSYSKNDAEIQRQILEGIDRRLALEHKSHSSIPLDTLGVKLESSTHIFKEQRGGISPIQSEGSQYSRDTTERKARRPATRDEKMELAKLMGHKGSYEVVDAGTPMSGNANILIKDFAIANLARKKEPFLQGIASRETSKMSSAAQPRQNRRNAQPPKVDKEKLKQMRVHGTHNANQDLFFDTEKEKDTGKTLIRVPLAQQSKFGGAFPQKTGNTYAIVKLEERELEKVMSKDTRLEISNIQQISQAKKETKQEVFFEDIYTFPIELNAKQAREALKRKNLDIGQRLQEEREQEKWDKIEQKLVQSRNLGYQKRSNSGAGIDSEVGGQAGGIGGSHFNYMNIDELKQHENGILNLFEGERNIGRYVSHNNEAQTGLGGGQKSRKYVRLSQFEYDTIFEKDPSFNEKKAFVEVFRRKWREDKGYCSMFDKRQKYRKAKSAANVNREKRAIAKAMHRSRQEHLMLAKVKEKQAKRQQDLLEKHLQAQRDVEDGRERESRQKSRLEQRALRRTRTKSPTRTMRGDKKLNQLPIKEDGTNLLFPLSKTDSLEFIMQGISNSKVKLVAGSIRSVSSPRAYSANPLGARNRSQSFRTQIFQPRVESSNVPVNRDKNDVKSAKSDNATTDDEMQLQGKQATMHQPLQNHDNDYLSNFITQMYQSTNMQQQQQPPKPLVQQIDVVQRAEALRNSSGSYELDIAQRASNSEVPIISEVTIDQTVIGKFLPDEAQQQSCQGTMKIKSPQDTPVDQSWRYGIPKVSSGTKGGDTQGVQSPQKSDIPGVQVSLYDKDIKIVAVASKERPGHSVAIKANKEDMRLIKAKFDHKRSNTSSRDLIASKTLPVASRYDLLKNDDKLGISLKGQKTILSHREQGRQNVQTVQEMNTKQTYDSGQRMTIEANINNQITSSKQNTTSLQREGGLRYSSGGTIPDPNYSSLPRDANESLNIQGATAVLFQSSDPALLLTKHKHSQQTESKSSKISDDPHDGSFMQPKNQRDSLDSRAQEVENRGSVYRPKKEGRVTISSKEKQTLQKNLGSAEGTNSSVKIKDSTRSKPKLEVSTSFKNQTTFGKAMRSSEQYESSAIQSKDQDQAAQSRQQRITVNSSYKSKNAAQMDLQRKENFYAQAAQLLDYSSVPPQNVLATGSVPSQEASDGLIRNPLMTHLGNEELMNSNQDLFQHADSAASGDRFTSEDWKLPILHQERSDSNLEIMMNQPRPSVYNLPHNPINQKSFKCNYIKSRVEATRMDFINQSQNFQFKIEQQLYGGQQSQQTPMENVAYANSIPLAVLENDSSKLALEKSSSNLRATSASSTFKHNVGNAYLKNLKLVQQRKKEQQFCYYLQQHRQNKQLLESLEKQAERSARTNTTMAANQKKNFMVAPRARSNYQSRKVKNGNARLAQARLNSSKIAHTPLSRDSATVRPAVQANLVIAGHSAVGGASALRSNKNDDIKVNTVFEDVGGAEGVDPKLLETNSPINRKIIKEAYLTFAQENGREARSEAQETVQYHNSASL